MGDTGDYDDIICPKCVRYNGDHTAVLEECGNPVELQQTIDELKITAQALIEKSVKDEQSHGMAISAIIAEIDVFCRELGVDTTLLVHHKCEKTLHVLKRIVKEHGQMRSQLIHITSSLKMWWEKGQPSFWKLP